MSAPATLLTTREAGLRRVALASLLVVAAVAGCRQQEPVQNLVLICIDTVRYDNFMQTTLPDALDPWLEHAQIYDAATATGPWTMPSVASALTGLYAPEHGAGRFADPVANLDTDPPTPLPDGASTLAETLADAGLRTAAFVAHPFFTTGLGLDQGFEVVHAAKGWALNLEKFGTWRQRLGKSERFFGYLHLMEAHDQHKPGTEVLLERLDELAPAVRRDIRARASEQACRDEAGRRCLQHQVYNAAILDLRTGIATVLQHLQDAGLLQNTAVIVYSDHGEEFWEHRQEQVQAAEDPRGVYGFGHGQSLYQELLHVPLLAWIPDQPGARHAQVVSLVDILPSALEWLRVSAGSETLSGRLLPVADGDAEAADPDRTVFASGIAYGPQKISARAGRLKTIFSPARDQHAYFDLAADPPERRPLTDDDRLVMMFDAAVGDYLELADATRTASSSQFSDEQIRQLKAIGYLQGVEADAESNAPARDDGPDANPPADNHTEEP